MPDAKKLAITVIAGFAIGVLAGLIGVGGGEFRIPILIGVLGLPIFFATATNLLIGILVSITSFARRFSLMTPDAYNTALLMGISSLLGGYFGAYLTSKTSERIAGYLLIIFLFLVGLKLASAPFLDIALPKPALDGTATAVLLLLSGFIIGILSGIFGVAGGEFRIPTLMFLFNMPVKLAGTTSSLIALPTQLGGLLKHHSLNHITSEGISIAVAMGAASVAGSFIGATLVFHIDEKLLEFILGLTLLFATYGIYEKMVAKNGKR